MARHRAFIVPRFFGSLFALAGLPVYVVVRGVPTALEFGIFAWFATPVLIVYYLARTARYESAHVLSSFSLTGLVTVIAFYSGGLTSFAGIWLVLVPLEAAVTGSRRSVLAAVAIALAAVGALLLADMSGSLPQPAPGPGGLGTFSLLLAYAYAAGLALGIESLARTVSSVLSAKEDRYRLLACNSSDVVIQHGRNRGVLYISPAAEQLLGTTVNELTGHRLFDRVHVADRPAYLTALADTEHSGEKRSLEFRIRRDADAHASGHYVWVEMQCRPIDGVAGSSGRARYDVVAVLRDISDRKAQERSIETVKNRSEHERTATSQFMAAMSHELRTPLNAIIGFSEIMMRNSSDLDPHRSQDYARLINASGQHLLAVINDVLDASRLESGNFSVSTEAFAPNAAIEHCADLLALKAREGGVDIKVRLARDIPDIAADRRAFNQILINLIANAVKFNRRGGEVIVAAQCEGPRLALTVEDTGIGIAAHDLPRLGQPFFQASASYDRHYEGSGLGLSIVKGLLDLHGGAMDISSRLGKGTRIRIWLPLAGQTARVPVPPGENITIVPPQTVKNWMKKSA